MKVQIWHAVPPNFFGVIEVARKFPVGFRHVANVDVMTLSEAFAVSQHIDAAWETGPDVTDVLAAQIRSTSVGDVLVDNAGLTFMVAAFGFEKLVPAAPRLLWMSFVDPDKPEGDRHLGCCLVEVTEAEIAEALADIKVRFPGALPGAELVAAAAKKAHRTGCNPGGEICSYDITDLKDEKTLAMPRHRLFQRAELEAMDLVDTRGK